MPATAVLPLRPGCAVEVRCHLGCPWVDGFVVVDGVVEQDDVLYRVQRATDGAMLPALFSAAYVRGSGPARHASG